MSDNYDIPELSKDPAIAARQKRAGRVVLIFVAVVAVVVIVAFFSMRSMFGL